MAAPPVVWDNVANLTPGMKNLGNQINRRFPRRNGDSDGALGNAAHQTETSDHNKDDTPGSKPGWEDADSKPDIRGIDVDNTLNDPDADAQDLVDHIRKLPKLNTVLRYIIYWEKMYHARDNFEPTPYTGVSAHREHVHFSGAYTEEADQNTTFNYQLDKLGKPQMLPIYKGDASEDVRYFQYKLEDIGYDVGEPDGHYGDKTQAAVDAHRAAHGQGPNDSITAWQALKIDQDMAKKYAGKDGKNGADGKFTGTFVVTDGTLIGEAQ